MSRLVSFYVLIAIIIALGLVVYRVLSTFLVPMFLACVLVVIFRPMHRKILERCNRRHHLAAGLSTVAILLIVLVPGTLIVTLAGIEGTAIVRQLDETKFRNSLISLRDRLGLTMPYPEEFRSLQQNLTQLIDDTSLGAPAVTHQRELHQLAVQFESLHAKVSEDHSVVDGERSDQILELLQTDLSAVPLEESSTEESDSEASDNLENNTESTTQTPAVRDYTNRELRSLLLAVETQLREYRERVLGGSYKASLVELLNPSEEELRRLSADTVSSVIRARWASVGANTAAFMGKLVLGLVITVVGVFFFFADGPAMIRTIMRLSPLDDRYEEELLDEFDRISRAVVVATLLSAVVQGLLAGLGFWFVGLDSVFLLILLTTFLALIPFVGAASVWLPVALWLYFIEGQTTAAIGLAIYGAAVISTADNIIKPLILHGQSRLHPLLALLSVLGGVQALGPIGILVGPMVVVFMQTLLNILHREIISIESHNGSSTNSPPTSRRKNRSSSRAGPATGIRESATHAGDSPQTVARAIRRQKKR